MSLMGKVGKSILNEPSKGAQLKALFQNSGVGNAMGNNRTSIGVGALGIGAAIHGFGKGIGNQDLSSRVYETTTGNAQMDNYVFGTDVNMRSLFAPMPFDRSAMEMRMFNRTIAARHFAGRRSGYDNAPPGIDGSVVLGAYNSRMG